VEYLGHIVYHEGVKVNLNKIKAMREWPIPKTLKKLRGFLIGFKSYYREFLKNHGQIMAPLKTLLKKEEFSWAQEETKDFEKLKEAMCTTHVLPTLDFPIFFIMECDASIHGIGAILIQ
jgi:hypothetical protein